MTVVEGLVAPARVGGLEQAYREATEQLPPGMVETFLVRATERPSVLRTVSLWADRDALDAMRASAPTPKGVEIFQDAGASPDVFILDVVAHRRSPGSAHA